MTFQADDRECCEGNVEKVENKLSKMRDKVQRGRRRDGSLDRSEEGGQGGGEQKDLWGGYDSDPGKVPLGVQKKKDAKQ